MTPPPPDGARGYHRIGVEVADARRTAHAAVPVPSLPMPRRRFLFDTPDRFVAGTVGEPGNRTFFLQARDGGRIVSVAVEKVQVAVLAQRLGDLLDELERRGIEGAEDDAEVDGDAARSTSRSTRRSGPATCPSAGTASDDWSCSRPARSPRPTRTARREADGGVRRRGRGRARTCSASG